MPKVNNKVEKWYLGYTKNNQEKLAKMHLENQHFRVFLPLILFEYPDLSKPDKLEVMFPSYIFIYFDHKNDDWHQINSTKGISKLVSFGDKFAEVPKKFIHFLMDNADDAGAVKYKLFEKELSEGDEVIINKGLFFGRTGLLFSKDSTDRVKILMSIFNQEVIVDLEESNISQQGKIKL